MVDGSELHRDLLLLIVRRINLIEDYLSFGSVCKSWNSVATKDNFNSSLPRKKIRGVENDVWSLWDGLCHRERIERNESVTSLLRSSNSIAASNSTTNANEFNRLPFHGPLSRKQFCQPILLIHLTMFSWSFKGSASFSVFGDQEICYGPGLGNRSLSPIFVVLVYSVVNLSDVYNGSRPSLGYVSQDGVRLRYVKDDWERIPLMHILGEDDEGEDTSINPSNPVTSADVHKIFENLAQKRRRMT
ncbi:hypothetical protein HAX54_008947 [Datura stramonium]|uniref:F-box domain-containing protein n=1 Tax=Datura stramonium TaxID=4076 RepID=A0ABS8RVZ9_DATST|nr:hypothetical protein [Datura stramonium]